MRKIWEQGYGRVAGWVGEPGTVSSCRMEATVSPKAVVLSELSLAETQSRGWYHGDSRNVGPGEWALGESRTVGIRQRD